jgi:hypothetical protein
MAYARFLHSHRIYKQLPMKAVSVLPDEGFDARLIEVTHAGDMMFVHCAPKGNGAHRLFAHCVCLRNIPIGRLGQHMKACQPLRTMLRSD